MFATMPHTNIVTFFCCRMSDLDMMQIKHNVPGDTGYDKILLGVLINLRIFHTLDWIVLWCFLLASSAVALLSGGHR